MLAARESSFSFGKIHTIFCLLTSVSVRFQTFLLSIHSPVLINYFRFGSCITQLLNWSNVITALCITDLNTFLSRFSRISVGNLLALIFFPPPDFGDILFFALFQPVFFF